MRICWRTDEAALHFLLVKGVAFETVPLHPCSLLRKRVWTGLDLGNIMHGDERLGRRRQMCRLSGLGILLWLHNGGVSELACMGRESSRSQAGGCECRVDNS